MFLKDVRSVLNNSFVYLVFTCFVSPCGPFEFYRSAIAVVPVRSPHIRAKRQWGGFGGCCVTTMVCCNMPMPMPMPIPIPPPMPVPVPAPVPVPQPVPMPMPMPVPVPVPVSTNCCSCCMPVCMSVCIRSGCGGGGGYVSGGCYGSSCGGGGNVCGGFGGYYGRKKRETILRRNAPAVYRKQIPMVVRD
ncbi:unnamed protein product [Caenorhabditis bovis]|uniref:Uncharacterized protein n=1 Tax=Caenorhabditis bovis TaxID=2654633 RepID=A0A8S1EBK3_9PELO|nr:unnamed protein product [Caenorhabditis bovis]